jgi:hypothetical protein
MDTVTAACTAAAHGASHSDRRRRLQRAIGWEVCQCSRVSTGINGRPESDQGRQAPQLHAVCQRSSASGPPCTASLLCLGQTMKAQRRADEEHASAGRLEVQMGCSSGPPTLYWPPEV